MKVIILTLGLPPVDNGGAEIATMQLSRCAARMGHEMHIITMGSKPEVEGVTVHQVPTLDLRYASGLFCVPNIVYLIHKIKPDLVHAQSSLMTPGAIAAKTLLGSKVLFYERGGVDTGHPANKYIYPVITRFADRIVAQTESQKLSLARYTQKGIEVIPNGVDMSRFGVTSKEVARKLLGLSPDKKVILSVGRCRPEKNQMVFVKVARSTNNPNHTFILVGDGPQLNVLKEAAEDKVVFVGAVDNSLIPTYMAAADVLVNTSLSEGFPMTLLEGLAAGLPIVAPNVCGIPEIIETGVNGILTNSQNYYSIVRAINRILDNPYMAKRMSEANKEKARLYTWENVVQKLYN